MRHARWLRTSLSAVALTLALAAASGAHATEVGIERPIGVGLVAGSSPGLSAKI